MRSGTMRPDPRVLSRRPSPMCSDSLCEPSAMGDPRRRATRGRSQLASPDMREVRIRDTLSGGLVSLDPGAKVGIYACGPTVYSRIHIGNARPFVVFSLFARFLRAEGYEPKLVINVTDVNDKIYDAARQAGEPSAEFAARMARTYFEDTGRLGLG